MRVAAILLALSALLIGVVPHYNNCQYEGQVMTLANGQAAPMRCYWTAQAEIALAIPLFGLALALGASRRKGSRRFLGLVGALLGLSVIALPTQLIGTCSMAQASCNMVMKPSLILLGGLVTTTSLGVIVGAQVQEEPARDTANPAGQPAAESTQPNRPAEG